MRIGEERKDADGDVEESWGDAELGLVLKEAAAMWGQNKGYARALEDFIEEHCSSFAEHCGVGFEDAEHSLHYHDLHAQYLSIFEGQISAFINREDYDVEDFFRECQGAMDDLGCALFEEHEEKWFVEALVSSMEYRKFFEKMVERAESSTRK